MWAAKDNGSKIDWANAKSYCENYRGGGYSDWRMPTLDELAGLYDPSKTRTVNCGLFNFISITELIHLTCGWYWAAETSGSDAAYFGFTGGGRNWVPQSGYLRRALPVRSDK
jgi:hypothetical protein